MSIAFAEVETSTRSESYVPRTSRTTAGLLRVLVVSEREERRSFLQREAELAGWQVTSFSDAAAAAAYAARHRHQLAIVDFDGLNPVEAGSFRSLSEELASDSRPLLMVCGTEGDALEEIWARQLGVWLYLPGVDTTCDISLLCGEARQVVGKLQSDEQSPWTSEAPYARTA